MPATPTGRLQNRYEVGALLCDRQGVLRHRGVDHTTGEAVVIVSAEEWKRKTRRKGTLAEFFANSPLRGSGIETKRLKDGPREKER